MNYGYLFIFWGPSKSRSEALHVAWSNLFFMWICSRVQYYCCCQIWLGTILLATMTTTHLHYKHKTNLMMTTEYSLFSVKRWKEKLGRICRGCGLLAAHSRAIFNQDFLTSFFWHKRKVAAGCICVPLANMPWWIWHCRYYCWRWPLLK